MLTIEDYMRFPKKRLAEMLVERDEQEQNRIVIPYQPAIGGQYNPSCYAPDGICTNPQMDCVNCPKKFNIQPNTGTYITTQQETLTGEEK